MLYVILTKGGKLLSKSLNTREALYMEIQRESIFVSSLRVFCKMFFGLAGIFLSFVLLSSLYNLVADSGTSPTEVKTNIKYLPDAKGERKSSTSSPVILQINIHGILGDPKRGVDSKGVQDMLLDSRTHTFDKGRVKGILLHMNTPGGTVVDSDNIYRMLLDYKKRYQAPVYAYIDGLCASGGMYVSSAADRVYAGPASIIGSVGVIIGPFFNIHEALLKIGVAAKTITKGINKDMMSPFRPWKPDESSSLQVVTDFFYMQFVDIVTKARKRLDREKLIHEYGAQVFDCVSAQDYGYIDVAQSSRDTALVELLKEANIDPESTYQVVELEPKNEWLQELFQTKSPLITGKIEHSIDTGGPEIKDQVAYLYDPMRNP